MSGRNSICKHVSSLLVASLTSTAIACGGGAGGSGYKGLVLATVTQSGTSRTFAVYADFVQPPMGTGTSGACTCGGSGLSTPSPQQPPDAGTLTLASAAATLATLKPSPFTSSGATFSGSFFGTSDLGNSEWSNYPGSYAPAKSLPWTPGEALAISSTGDQVSAFSATLRTGVMLAGVTPAIGGAPVLVPRSRDFEVTWTPAGAGPDQVILMLDLSSGAFSCSCTAPDSAGKVTLRSSLLSQPGSSPSSGTIRLARTTTSTVPVDNATIDLVGEVAVSGAVKLQ